MKKLSFTATNQVVRTLINSYVPARLEGFDVDPRDFILDHLNVLELRARFQNDENAVAMLLFENRQLQQQIDALTPTHMQTTMDALSHWQGRARSLGMQLDDAKKEIKRLKARLEQGVGAA